MPCLFCFLGFLDCGTQQVRASTSEKRSRMTFSPVSLPGARQLHSRVAADATFSLSFSDCLFHAPSPLLSHHSQRAQGEVGRPCPPLGAAISRTLGRQTGRGLGKRACQELGFVGQWNRFPEGKVCDCHERALAASCEWSQEKPS